MFTRFVATRSVLSAMLFAVMALGQGCAQAPLQVENRGDISQAPRPIIKEVHSKTLDDRTIVTIRASAPFEFIAYKLRNPDRLAVELVSVKSSLPGPSVTVGDRLVGMISVLTFKQSQAVRMEIGLKQDCDFETKMTGSSLDVTLIPIDNSELKLVQKELGQARSKIDELGLEMEKLKEEIALLEKDRGLDEAIISQLKMQIASEEEEQPDDEAAYAQAPKEDETNENADVLIRKSLMGWYAAWKAKEIVDYSVHYSETFTYKRGGKKDWIKSKQKKFKKSGDIEVIIKGIDISVSGENAVVSFTQHYKSATYEDVGIKTLTMRNTDDGWKIETESWRAIK